MAFGAAVIPQKRLYFPLSCFTPFEMSPADLWFSESWWNRCIFWCNEVTLSFPLCFSWPLPKGEPQTRSFLKSQPHWIPLDLCSACFYKCFANPAWILPWKNSSSCLLGASLPHSITTARHTFSFLGCSSHNIWARRDFWVYEG